MAHEYGFEEIFERIQKQKEKDIEFMREVAGYTFSELSDPQLEHLYGEYSNNWSASWLRISSEEDIKSFVDWVTTTPLEKVKNMSFFDDIDWRNK